MRLPWISRERYDEQRAELERMREEVKALTAAKEKLWNVMLWRMGGVIVDVGVLPEVYQPKAPAESPKTEGPKQPPAAVNPRDVRKKIAQFEVKQESDFMAASGRPRPEPQQVAVVAELNKTANEVAS